VPRATLGEDWTFQLQNLFGRQYVRVLVSEPGWYLESVTAQGADLTDEPIDLANAAKRHIVIRLSNRSASVAGMVRYEGQAVTSCDGCAVVVFSADASKLQFPSRFVAVSRPDNTGRYHVDGLPPGMYFVAAAPQLRDTDWRDVLFLESLRPVAQLVKLTADATSNADVTLAR
jgi:hypothetical protein